MIFAFYVLYKKPCFPKHYKDVTYFRDFVDLDSMFKFMIHFELILYVLSSNGYSFPGASDEKKFSN